MQRHPDQTFHELAKTFVRALGEALQLAGSLSLLYLHVMVRFALSATAVAMVFAASATAAEPRRFAPTANWNIDYQPDRCRLSRTFSDGAEELTLTIERFEAGDNFSMAISGPPIRNLPEVNAEYRFAEQSEYSGKRGVSVFAEDLGRAVLFRSTQLFSYTELKTMGPAGTAAPQYTLAPFGTFRIVGAMEATRSDLFIRQGRREFHLQSGSWGPPMEALRTCVTDLIVSWGLDTKVQQNLRSLPVPLGDRTEWLRPGDFPDSPLQSRQHLTFRLMVDAQGSPTNCVIYGPLKPEGYGDDLCKALLGKAKFTPAVDADGKPVASFWRSTATLLP